MTFRDFVLICIVAPLVVVALLGSMWLVLEYYDNFFPSNDSAPQKVECAEEDGDGLCGIKRFFKHGASEVEYNGEIDL